MVPCPFVGVFGKPVLSQLDLTYLMQGKSAENLGSVGGGCRVSSDRHHSGFSCRFQLGERGSPFHRILLLDSGAGW